MNIIKCPNCGQENKNTNIKCEFCGTDLNFVEQNDNFTNVNNSQINTKNINLSNKVMKYIINGFLIFTMAPILFFVIVCIFISLYFNITNYIKSKDYVETEGRFVNYQNCKYNGSNEVCEAVYQIYSRWCYL